MHESNSQYANQIYVAQEINENILAENAKMESWDRKLQRIASQKNSNKNKDNNPTQKVKFAIEQNQNIFSRIFVRILLLPR